MDHPSSTMRGKPGGQVLREVSELTNFTVPHVSYHDDLEQIVAARGRRREEGQLSAGVGGLQPGHVSQRVHSSAVPCSVPRTACQQPWPAAGCVICSEAGSCARAAMLTSHRVADAVVVGGACCEVLHGSCVQDTCRQAMLDSSNRAHPAPTADSISQGLFRANSLTEGSLIEKRQTAAQHLPG